MHRAIATLLLAALAAPFGCASPGAVSLPPEDEPVAVRPDEDETPPGGLETPESAPVLPPDAPPEVGFRRISHRGVNGGEARFTLPGAPEDVASMLVDFNHMTGRRPWAVRYTHLSTDGDIHRSEWAFAGKAGMDPVCILRHRVERPEGRIIVRFQLERPDFGLAAFFGDIALDADGRDPGRTRVRQRLFIDSGVLIANASFEDIEAGLRQDALDMDRWMRQRLAPAESRAAIAPAP